MPDTVQSTLNILPLNPNINLICWYYYPTLLLLGIKNTF